MSGIHEGNLRRHSSITEPGIGDRRTGSLLHNRLSVDIKDKEHVLVESEPEPSESIINGALTTKVQSTKEEDKVEEEEEDEEAVEVGIMLCPCLPLVKTVIPSMPIGDSGCLAVVKLILHWMLFLISFPFVVAFSWTIPNCAKSHLQKYFLVSFVMAVFWIAVLSFCMVTVVGRAGCILGVDKFTMGLVVVAIGTSVPVRYFTITRESQKSIKMSNLQLYLCSVQ